MNAYDLRTAQRYFQLDEWYAQHVQSEQQAPKLKACQKAVLQPSRHPLPA